MQGTKVGLVLTFKVRFRGGYKGFMKGFYWVSKIFKMDLQKIYKRFYTNFIEKGFIRGRYGIYRRFIATL